jgi:hypothetical protein
MRERFDIMLHAFANNIGVQFLPNLSFQRTAFGAR